MKKIGLVGGLGWPATAAYYQALCVGAERRGSKAAPAITVESLDMSRTLAARGVFGDAESWDAFDEIFVASLGRLKDAGCEIAAIASATPHCRIASILEQTPLPVVNLLDATAKALEKIEPRRIVILATTPTVQARLFHDLPAMCGFEPDIPMTDPDNSEFSQLLTDYFYCGRAMDGRGPLIQYCRNRTDGHHDPLVLLGCTDLAPAFPERNGSVLFTAEGLSFFDAMQAHVDTILKGAGSVSAD